MDLIIIAGLVIVVGAIKAIRNAHKTEKPDDEPTDYEKRVRQ